MLLMSPMSCLAISIDMPQKSGTRCAQSTWHDSPHSMRPGEQKVGSAGVKAMRYFAD